MSLPSYGPPVGVHDRASLAAAATAAQPVAYFAHGMQRAALASRQGAAYAPAVPGEPTEAERQALAWRRADRLLRSAGADPSTAAMAAAALASFLLAQPAAVDPPVDVVRLWLARFLAGGDAGGAAPAPGGPPPGTGSRRRSALVAPTCRCGAAMSERAAAAPNYRAFRCSRCAIEHLEAV